MSGAAVFCGVRVWGGSLAHARQWVQKRMLGRFEPSTVIGVWPPRAVLVCGHGS